MKKYFFRLLDSGFWILNSSRLRRRGFTIIEILIFSALFSVMAISFVAALVSTIQVQTKQVATAEVNQQSQLLLDAIQYYVQLASLVELPADTATTTLKLRVSSSTIDPIYIYASGTVAYLKQTDSGTPQPLTSDKVNVSNLTFTKRANTPGHDLVSVAFTVAYNSSSVLQSFLQNLSISVARVGAVTFDSNVLPSVTNTYNLGVTSQIWQSINSTIYFSGSNVGIGTSNPNYGLDVNGTMRVSATSTFSGNVGIGTDSPSSSLTVAGVIRSTSGGFAFPDNTTQTTAAASSTSAPFNNVQVFTTSSTFTVPSGITKLWAEVYGGGGGGGATGGGSGTSGGGGGGGGGVSMGFLTVTPSQNITVTVGSGGGAGTAGATSTFSTIVASGGRQGGDGSANSGGGGGGGGIGSGGSINQTGGSGGSGSGGGLANGYPGGNGGSNTRGGGGNSDRAGASNPNGGVFGGGGGGAGSGGSSAGSGGGGGVIVWW